jgi:hypothetical protein
MLLRLRVARLATELLTNSRVGSRVRAGCTHTSVRRSASSVGRCPACHPVPGS